MLKANRVALVAAVSVLTGLGAGLGLTAAASGPAAEPPGGPPHFPHMDHVFVIMMENTSYSRLLTPSNAGTSYIRALAATYGLETDYFGVTHTSLPNYVAATSGSTWGSNTDDEAQATDGYFNHLNLADQLDQAHVSWKGYMESMPSAGYTGNYGNCTTAGVTNPTCSAGHTGTALYVRKHNPFMQYPDIFGNPQRADQVVPLAQLSADLNAGDAPQFAWITPNVCDDMHGGAPECPYPTTTTPGTANQQTLYRDGNSFVQTWVSAITSSRAWTGNSAIFVTWDEGSYANSSPYGPEDDSGCCDSPVLPATPTTPKTGGGGDLAGGTLYGGGHVPMIVIARHGARGVTDSAATNHYSLLQTIESNWRLPFLGNASDTVQVQSLAPLLGPGGS